VDGIICFLFQLELKGIISLLSFEILLRKKRRSEGMLDFLEMILVLPGKHSGFSGLGYSGTAWKAFMWASTQVVDVMRNRRYHNHSANLFLSWQEDLDIICSICLSHSQFTVGCMNVKVRNSLI